MNTWIVWMLKCVGLDWSRTPAISGDPSAAEGADYLTLSSKCVRGISSQVAGGRENLLAQKQCRDLSSKLLKTIGNITELVFNFEASSTVAFVPALKDFHRAAEKSRLLVDSCSNPDWLRAAVLQIHNEEAFREILLEVGLCYNVIHEQAKEMSLSDGLIFEVEDLRLGQTFLPTSETEVVEDQEALRRRLEKYLAKNSGSSNDYILARYLLGRLMKSSISDGRTIEGSTMTNSPILMQMTEKEQRGCWDVANSPIGGGAGAICVSRTKFLGIPCAKKCFLHYEGDLTFWEEASLLASLNHPNIVKFFCCGSTAMISQGESKQCFIGMELLEMSLDEVIKRQAKERQPFPILVALDIILQMARGMLYLHDLGIAHRDIKPHNVVVDEVGNGFFSC
ncbi:hypothetical protein M758_1G261900 [Ceratodon purpureus]|nr:hypothetical protein M758_1G261900 [Ceratodon purpureus]